jgi:predicted glycogen debranching enzyme
VKPIRFGQNICTDLHRASRLEWLETNGLGGFASGTVAGVNTRRYHGVLTAAMKPPDGRVLLLSKLEETVVIDGERFDLSTNQYPGAVQPNGFEHLREFRLDPFPIAMYEVNGLKIEKRLFMVYGEDTTVIEYEIHPTRANDPLPDWTLEIRPLIAFRDYHGATRWNETLDPSVESTGHTVTVAPYSNLPPLHFSHDALELECTAEWYYNFEHLLERDRGLDFTEDLFNPFVLRFGPAANHTATLIVSTGPRHPRNAAQLRNREIERRQAIVEAAPLSEPIVQLLTAAADQYIVQRGELKTIVSGYHWFGDRSRDTMIALPGLTLVTGRFDVAAQILRTFAENIDQGMLPDHLPDAGEEPEFNTADATLWFFEATRSYLQYTEDFEFVREHLYDKLKDIVDWHLRGTRCGTSMDADGLLCCMEPKMPMTWMNARVGDFVVTPRSGKPVEIQALWYNALRIMEELAGQFDELPAQASFRDLADRVKRSFNAEFWNADDLCLYDVVDRNLHDGSLRPNQIFAVSLKYSMLPPECAREVVDLVQRELLTPVGLRSLGRFDPRYHARYEGSVHERDAAYHQGTVWPWLMGPFLTAYLRVHGSSADARKQARMWLEDFQSHLTTAGLGHISEIANAEDGNEPRGCIAQAWSVAELLRAAVEDVYQAVPAQEKARSISVAD